MKISRLQTNEYECNYEDAATYDSRSEENDLQSVRCTEKDKENIAASSPYIRQLLENTKLEMFQDQVFCFSPKGELYSLPTGSTPVDFAYAVHTQVGDTCVGAKVNGRITPLRSVLQNGDQVEIMISTAQTPSPDIVSIQYFVKIAQHCFKTYASKSQNRNLNKFDTPSQRVCRLFEIAI